MKTWITYTTALLMGLAVALLFGNIAGASAVINAITSYLINLGMFITIPMIVFSFPSAIASIRKDMIGGKCAKNIILWTILTTLLLPFVSSLLYIAFPFVFPVTSSAGSSGDLVGTYTLYMLQDSLYALHPVNPFYTVMISSKMIVALTIVMWIFGCFLKPSSDTIRPAYAVMNSFSEVMYRIAKFYAVFGYIMVFFSSSNFFLSLYEEKTVLAAPVFAICICATTLIILFILLPLLFSFMTGFKRNPYKSLHQQTASLILALTSADVLFCYPAILSLSRTNQGVQKRISSSTGTFSLILSRGGSAAVITTITLSMIYAITGNMDINIALLTAFASSIVSFTLAFFPTMETVIGTFLVLKLLNVNLYGAEAAIISIIPFVGGLASMLDAAIAFLSGKITAANINIDTEAPYKDLI